MDKYRSHVTERVLRLTLEIVYLLTGQDYSVVKRTSGESTVTSSSPHVSEGWSRTQSDITEAPLHSPILERNTEQKILEFTSKIIELLTGEVPIRYEDITVCFSMEEWEYVERYKELYKEVVMENHLPLTSPDVSSIVIAPERELNIHPTKQDEQDGDLIDIKVEVIEEEEKYMTCDQRSKKEKAKAYTASDQKCKEKEEETKMTFDEKCKKEEVIEDKSMTFYHKGKEAKTHINICQGKHSNKYCEREVYLSPKLSPQETGDASERPPALHNLWRDPSNPKQYSHANSNIQNENCTEDNVHPGSKCGKLVTNLTGQQRIHTVEKVFSCMDCRKCFTSEANLMQHWRIHMEEKPFLCCECGECFMSKVNLTKHFRVHSGEKSFQCPECEKCFKWESTLFDHKKIHTGGPQYHCSKCSKSFVHRFSFMRHKKLHTEERAFSCSECGKCFLQKCDFTRHLRIHTGEKPFMCLECGKCFTQKPNLVRHQKTHNKITH